MINSASPGEILYHNTIKATSVNFTLTVVESNSLNWKPMLIQDIGQAYLYNANCSKASIYTTTSTNGNVIFTIKGATIGAIYYIGIKYTPANLVGQPVKQPYPTSTYSWATAGIPGSTGSIPVKPK